MKIQMSEREQIMALHKKLVKSKQFTFPPKGKLNISERHGVYIIYSATDQVLHVGNTPSGKGGLNQRLYNHVSRTSSFSRKYLAKNNISLRENGKCRIIEESTPRTRALLEALTIGLLCPAHIGTGEKKTVQVV